MITQALFYGKKLARKKRTSLLGLGINATVYPLLFSFQIENPSYIDGQKLARDKDTSFSGLCIGATHKAFSFLSKLITLSLILWLKTRQGQTPKLIRPGSQRYPLLFTFQMDNPSYTDG